MNVSLNQCKKEAGLSVRMRQKEVDRRLYEWYNRWLIQLVRTVSGKADYDGRQQVDQKDVFFAKQIIPLYHDNKSISRRCFVLSKFRQDVQGIDIRVDSGRIWTNPVLNELRKIMETLIVKLLRQAQRWQTELQGKHVDNAGRNLGYSIIFVPAAYSPWMITKPFQQSIVQEMHRSATTTTEESDKLMPNVIADLGMAIAEMSILLLLDKPETRVDTRLIETSTLIVLPERLGAYAQSKGENTVAIYDRHRNEAPRYVPEATLRKMFKDRAELFKKEMSITRRCLYFLGAVLQEVLREMVHVGKEQKREHLRWDYFADAVRTDEELSLLLHSLGNIM
jgi:hypothetical protein